MAKRMTKAQAKRSLDIIRSKAMKLLSECGYTASPFHRCINTKDFEDIDKVLARISNRLK